MSHQGTSVLINVNLSLNTESIVLKGELTG